MPYLDCPRCHRTAWVRSSSHMPEACRHCGAPYADMSPSDLRLLTVAVRERFARDAARTTGMKRFRRA